MENTISKQQLLNISNLLKYTFVIVPIVAGVDKFLNLLTDWTQYLGSGITEILPFSASVFMIIVGIIEIIAGLIVLKKPEIGGLIVAAWLTLIALSLLAGFHYFDLAVRDLVMAIAAYSMARLTEFTKYPSK